MKLYKELKIGLPDFSNVTIGVSDADNCKELKHGLLGLFGVSEKELRDKIGDERVDFYINLIVGG